MGILGYDEGLSQVPQQRWLNQIAGDRRFVFRSNDLVALLNAARVGLGIAAFPHFLRRMTQPCAYCQIMLARLFGSCGS